MSTTPKGGGYVRPCVSVPADLADLYETAAHTLPGFPPLSHLLADAMRAALLARGIVPPEPPAASRTAAATAARWKPPAV